MKLQELKNIVTDIYNSYEPMSHMDEHLFNNDNHSEIKKITDQKIKPLTKNIRKRIYDELFHWGPLESIKDDINIFDIIINGPENIFIETPKGLQKLNDQFLSFQSFQNFTEELFKQANLQISHKEPFGNGSLPPFRVHAIAPPMTKEINITLRRHRTKSISLEELLKDGFLNEQQYFLIQKIIKNQSNFLVIGPTGCGKTTFLNSIIQSLPPFQRLVIIEDTDELQIKTLLSAKLLSRETCPDNLNKITMEDLVKQALRMRPDRLLVGEVRGPEAKDLLQALATGHSGSMGTLHAQSPQQAIYRLEMLIQMGAPQWDLQSIRRLIQMSLDYLIVLKEDRYNKGIEGIYKIASIENFGLLLNKED